MLRLLLDEMYTGLKQHFEILGHDVETVQDADLKGVEDRRVVRVREGSRPVAGDHRSEGGGARRARWGKVCSGPLQHTDRQVG